MAFGEEGCGNRRVWEEGEERGVWGEL